MKLLSCCLVTMGLLSTPVANAFDNERRGFVIGLGAGLHTLDIDYKYSGELLASQSEKGIATSFKIGFGVTNQFLVYYVRKASWFNAPVFDGVSVSDTTIISGISGIGVSYYLSGSAPSAYFLGAFGIGDLSAPFESAIETDTGSAYMFGAGYEVSEHVQFEATILKTNIDSKDDANFVLESSSIQFTANYLWY